MSSDEGIGAANQRLRSLPGRSLVLGWLTGIVILTALSSPRLIEAGSRPPPTPTVDPRLILHPHTVRATTRVSGLGRLRLSLYPAIPGVQHVAVTVSHPPNAGWVILRADMPGMRMRTSVGRLARHGRSPTFRGDLRLSMFGVYRVSVWVGNRGVGALRVILPLPPL